MQVTSKMKDASLMAIMREDSKIKKSTYEKVVGYEIPEAVTYVAVNRFGVKQEQVEPLWTELKRYFVLSLKYGNMPMLSEDVDKIWHSFILDLNSYVQFSEKIGKMIMHAPNLHKEENAGNGRVSAKVFYEAYEKEFGEIPLYWKMPDLKDHCDNSTGHCTSGGGECSS